MLTGQSFEVLDEDECYALLRTGLVGRVGISIDALPAILPVRYAIVDGAIIFRTDDGMKLRAALDRTVVAFEIDFIDPDRHEGWSVLAVGLAEFVTEAGETVVDLRAPWVVEEQPCTVRIRPETVTGRRGLLA